MLIESVPPLEGTRLIELPPATDVFVKSYVVFVSVDAIVTVSVVAFVVIVTLLPAASVSVSLLLSATTVV